MVYSHGTSNLGNGSSPYEAVTFNGPLKEIKLGHTVPGLNDGFIIIGAQYGQWPQPKDIDSVIAYALKHYRIRGKVFSTGLSMGGGTVWDHSATNSVVDLAAIVPISGASEVSDEKAATIAGHNLPVWTFNGTADPKVPVEQTADWVNRINSYTPTSSPSAKLTTFLGVQHDAWSQVYAGYSENGINIYQWMLSHDTGWEQYIGNTTTLTNKMPGETFAVNLTATSGLAVSYTISTNPSTGVIKKLEDNSISCTGIGSVTITGTQYGTKFYRPANFISVFRVQTTTGTDTLTALTDSEINYDPIVIYPNPGSGEIFVEGIENGDANIISTQGKELGNYKLNGKTAITIKEKGIHFLRIKSSSGILSRKIVIQ